MKESEGMIAEKDEALNEEVLDGVAESETQEESSTSEQDSQQKAGEAEKTKATDGSAESAEADDLAGLKEGQSIPYERFKKVIEQKNRFKGNSESLTTELEEARGYIQNPDIFRAILMSKGITDKSIQDTKLKEAGFEVKETKVEGDVYKSITQGLDLNTQEGWLKAMERAVKTFGKELVGPIQAKLSEADKDKWVREQETKAQATAKKYNIEYGKVGQTENDSNTAVGMMMAYIRKNPDDARLGHDKILKLALEEKGFELGKQKGLDEAKQRNENLKKGQMEDDSMRIGDAEPSSDASTRDIMNWHRRNVK